MAACFRVLIPIILEGHYRPQPPRKVEIAKTGGGTRELRLQVVVDRIIARMLYEAICPYVDSRFVSWSFGFRPNKSTYSLLAKLKVHAEANSHFVVTTDDVRKAFDCVPIEPLLENLAEVLRDHHYLNQIAAIVRKKNDDGKEIATGIDQGNALSPLLLNLFLHMRLDILLAEEAHHPSQPFRYADNVGHLTWDAREGQRLLDCTREFLLQAGLSLKGAPGRPVDLRDEPQALLGFDVSARGDRVHLEVSNEAWEELKTELNNAHTDPNPPKRVNSIVQGWISSTGPALDHRTESTTRHVNQHLSATGFKEIISKDTLRRWIADSLNSWYRILHRTEKNH